MISSKTFVHVQEFNARKMLAAQRMSLVRRSTLVARLQYVDAQPLAAKASGRSAGSI
jgi:hypothetical protein